jgi:enamine deaminase RidA (YjgF/YER057c/UK114 family)
MSPAGTGTSFHLAEHARLGRFVVLSAALPLDDADRVVAGDIGDQTRCALERLGQAARRAGASLQRAAAVHVWLRDAADFAAMNAAYAPFFPVDPPTRTTIVGGLAEPAARIAVSAVVVADGEPREVVHPAGWKPSAHPYSFGVRSGDTLFLAGLVSRRGQDGVAVEGDVAVQTRAILDNARALLGAAGMTFADVVSARVFITSPEAFGPMNAVYKEAFDGTRPPARATVVAPLMLASLEVEITFVAVRDAGRVVVGPAGPLPFSPAIAAGDGLFVAGMLGNVAGARVDTPTQTREIVARVGATLEQGGCTWSDVREALIYVTDAALAPAVLAELARACPQGLPAGTVVQTALVVPDATVEIMATAVRGTGGP